MNYTKLYSLIQQKLFTDLSLTLVDRNNNRISIDVNKNILFASCDYFEKLLTNCKEKNSNNIVIEVANIYIMYDAIMGFYGQETNLGNIPKNKHLLELMLCYNFLGLDIDQSSLDNIEVSEEDFELFLSVIDLIGYDEETIELINNKIPKNYDLSKLSKELLNEMLLTEKTYYIISGGSDKWIYMWNKDGKMISRSMNHNGDIRCIRCSPDGRYVISVGYENTVRIWEAVTGILIKKFSSKYGPVWCVCYSPDGKQIASGNEHGDIEIWDANTYKLIQAFGRNAGVVRSLCYSPDGKRIVSGTLNHYVQVWDIQTGIIYSARDHVDSVNAVCYSLDGKYIISGSSDSTIKIFNAETFTYINILRDHSGGVFSLCYSSDNKWFASGGVDGIIRLWDTSSNKLVKSFNNESIIQSICFSPDNEYVISAHCNDKINIWDIHTGDLVNTLKGHTGSVMSVQCLSNPNTELVQRIMQSLREN